MKTPIFYKAFGLVIASDFPIVQLPKIEPREPDVRIVRADLSQLTEAQRCFSGEHGCYFRGIDRCAHRVTGGNLIEVDPQENFDLSALSVYLMGTCMGAILYQRGLMMLHGSCITDGTHAVLLTGDSGAGKSTLAAEFLRRGWKLLTDDVALIHDPEGVPMVQASYPSQKLWRDTLERYERPEEELHSLYLLGGREKFGVDASRFFYDGQARLSMVVRLLPGEEDCHLEPLDGMTKVDQLLYNTYRKELIEHHRLQPHFQRCVTLSTRIPMVAVTRVDAADCAGSMYKLITDYLERGAEL